MALIKCPECGQNVSSLAESCPNCGYPLNAPLDELKKDQTKVENNPNTTDNLETNVSPFPAKVKRPINSKLIILSSVGIIVLLCILLPTIIIPSIQYSKAVTLLEEGSYTEAKLILYGLGDFKDAKDYLNRLDEVYPDNITAVLYNNSTLCLKNDGTVLTTGGSNTFGELNVSDWTDIIEITCGLRHTVGLKTDGTVIATGNNDFGQCDVSSWSEIVQINAFFNDTIGLKSDGTVVATGKNSAQELNVGDWTNIVKVCQGDDFACGLKKDGTVVVAGDTEGSQYNQAISEITSLKNVIDISCGVFDILALKSDGTVELFGEENIRKYDTEIAKWKNIVKVYSGIGGYFGLKKDGSVVCVSDFNKYGECNVSYWNDIISVASDGSCTVGVRRNGTVVAIGNNEHGQCNVNYWTNIGKYIDY